MGVTRRVFPEVLSPFLTRKLAELEETHAPEDWQRISLERQYVKTEEEDVLSNLDRLRHYNADMAMHSTSDSEKGVERLYKRTMLIELTTACFANCRWCLRSNYDRFALSKDEIEHNLSLFGTELARDTVREILITGGDPFTSVQRLDHALTSIPKQAPNIEVVRIGSRIFTQNPERIDDEVIQMLVKHRKNLRIEIGTHINSPVEFWPETVEALERVQDAGVVVYNQHPLLKGVNDKLEVLVELYDNCRRYGIETHYMFHCVPMRGMAHHRTSVQKGVDLSRRLSSGGYISGRSKPQYVAMTDIGKITFYEGTIVDRRHDSNEVLLQSGYSLEERRLYNPGFELPDAAEVDENGMLRVWYADGVDEDLWGDE